MNFFIVKQANGLYRWTSTSSNNIRDRDDEIVSLTSLQADVARTKMFGDTSEFYFYHIPYPIGGAPDYRAIVDGMLIETGEFYDEPVAKTVAQYMIDNPQGLDGSGWGASIGFLGVPDRERIYHAVLIHERSVLPLSAAANAYTSFGVRGTKMALDDKQRAALDTVLHDPSLLQMVLTAADAQEKSKMADTIGQQRKMAQGDQMATVVRLPVGYHGGRLEAQPAPQPKTVNRFQMQRKQEGVEAVAAEAVDAVAIAEQALEQAAVAIQEVATEVVDGTVAPVEGAAVQTAAVDEDAAPKASALTDQDITDIKTYIDEQIKVAIAKMSEITEEAVDKMVKAAQQGAKVEALKMVNRRPATTLDRLKAASASHSDRTQLQVGDPLYAEKGKNLPDAPTDSRSAVLNALGFKEGQ